MVSTTAFSTTLPMTSKECSFSAAAHLSIRDSIFMVLSTRTSPLLPKNNSPLLPKEPSKSSSQKQNLHHLILPFTDHITLACYFFSSQLEPEQQLLSRQTGLLNPLVFSAS